jgi:glutamate N-acetyltransferase/amino-acid N-acetyltransferase
MTSNQSSAGDPLPAGFRFAGVACGIKPSGKLDLSLIVAERPVVAAGVYTQNQIVAAPVVWCRQRTPSASVRAVVTNSGNANACTGDQGTRDTAAMAQHVAEHLGCDASQVLVMSTGVIGRALPMSRVRQGIDDAWSKLGQTRQHYLTAAQAILTTDVGIKVASRQVHLPGAPRPIRVSAMAKGAGMIAPNMATLLAVICTDATLVPEDAQLLIRNAAKVSFNRASVDGHTSTNDTLLLLASGSETKLSPQDRDRLGEVINEVSIDLAKALVADGEGATHVMAIRVGGATDDAAAESIARCVAASPLVKTAITGADPNWGRIVSAAGYSDQPIQPARTSLEICGTMIYRDGNPLDFDAAALSQTMRQQEEISIRLTVGDGPGQAIFWASDLTVQYVRFNSEYTT